MISDGFGNVGDFMTYDILDSITESTRRNIVVTTIGVGGYHDDDVLMETLANRGNGSYHYINQQQTTAQFAANIAPGILSPSPREARVQVDFDPDTARKFRLIGYENRKVPDDAFLDDTRDFGEPGFGRDVTALYEIRLHPEPAQGQPLLTVKLRYRMPSDTDFIQSEHSFTTADITTDFNETSPHFQRTAHLAEFAEILRGSPWTNCQQTASALQSLIDTAPIDEAGTTLSNMLQQSFSDDWDKNCDH